MKKAINFKESVLSFWDERANLGDSAGTKDLIAKTLEVRNISTYLRDGMKVMDVGCGNGTTSFCLAKEFDVDIFAVDFSEKMVSAARNRLQSEPLKGSITFQQLDIEDLLTIGKKFDLIYTERCLINLPDWENQRQAIVNILKLLEPGGLYVMCENSQNGLDQINQLRNAVGLNIIEPPWHNRYINENEVLEIQEDAVKLTKTVSFTSTYYFLSRVVNAWLAAQDGIEPAYDAPINQLALKLPIIGEMGQTKIWLWKKQSD